MKILTLTVFIILLTSFKQKDEVYIWFPHEVGDILACNENEVEFPIEITTNEAIKNIQVHSFKVNKVAFTLYNDNIEISKSDSLILSATCPLKLKVKCKLPGSERFTIFSFKTNVPNYPDNQVILKYGYLITSQDIHEGKEQIINVTESCQDSIKVFFPYCGTVYGATLYTDSTSTKKAYKSVSYSYGLDTNFLVFSKADIGSFYVQYSTCHWGNDFWLTIK